MTRITGDFHEDLCTFIIIFYWIIFRMRNVKEISCIENQNTILFSVTLFWKSCQLWDNVEKYDRDRQTTDDK